jgi:hypothetical protein
MKLSEFIDIFTVVLYHYSELNGVEYYRAGQIIEAYQLPFKQAWGQIIFDDYDFSSRVKSARSFGGFGQQAVMLTADGIRWVEEEIGEDAIVAYLEQHGIANPFASIDELAEASKKLAPAAGRLVKLSHNQPERSAILTEIKAVSSAIAASNTLEPEEKSDVLANLSAAETLVEKSDTWFAGAMKYLVFDRVQKAFEKLIEDSIRYVIIGSLITLATIIMALI